MSTLILLVGTNPLPNYVVAKYLYTHGPAELKPEKVLLIHTTATKDIAQRLQFALENEVRAKFEKLHCFDDPFNPVLQANLRDVLSRNIPIHLNYTGGTKALGVQVHQLVKNLDKADKFQYSYLDASDHLLRFDDGRFLPETDTGGLGIDMRKKVEISLDTIRYLHNLELIIPKKKVDETYLAPVGQWLFENLVLNTGNGSMLVAYKDWIKQFRKGEKLVVPTELLSSWPWPIAPNFEEFGKVVKENAKWKINSSDNFGWNNLTTDNKEDLLKYLDGLWLERPVYELLTGGSMKYSPPLTKYQFDVKLRRNKTNTEMQLDTVLLRGYELANISITTETERRDIIKGKAFEAYYRAQQLGGEQAMGIVISLENKDLANSIMRDLQTDFGTDAQLRLKILGLPHLRKLAQGDLTGDDLFEPDKKQGSNAL